MYFNPYAPIETHRNRLPHWQQEDREIFVTWRLADSIPQEQLVAYKNERARWLNRNPPPWSQILRSEYRRKFVKAPEDWLDQGHGSCLLRDSRHSLIVAEAFHHFEGIRYELGPWVIMPNHVHLLLKPKEDFALARIIASWKSFSARRINQLRGDLGPIWQKDYWDRLIRDEAHHAKAVRYISNNPLKANIQCGQFLLSPKKS